MEMMVNNKILERSAQDQIARAQVSAHHPPHIFVIDWDGTIAGQVDYQSQYYGVLSMLRKHRFKPNVTNIVPHAFSPKAKLYGEVYFFVYTASEKRWAHQEIAWVEKLHDIKFDRPIFTRGDCSVEAGGNLRKSLAKVFPRMMAYISKRRIRAHGDLAQPLTSEQRITILKNYTMVIDNNAVYSDHTDKLLLCPDYGYSVFENLLNVIPKEARDHPAIQQLIYSLINSGYVCGVGHARPHKHADDVYKHSNDGAQDHGDDGMRELTRQYHWLTEKCKTICRSNDAYMDDDFWKYLKKVIVKNNIQVFTPSIVKQLQEGAWKRSKLQLKKPRK
jgi:hypothetical protein